MKDNSTVNQLSATQVLAGYSEADREILSAYGEFITFKEKATVIKEKNTQDSLYFVIKGTLKAIHQLEVGATPVGTIRTGEWFGEVNIFDPSEASADVVAQVETQVWRISRTKLEAFLNAHPHLGCELLLGVAEVLARRTRDMVSKLNATWELSW